ncbi:MAG: PqqD family peptide modification chaperone, partial [Thermodesulfobacteriota bacterium]
MATSPFSPSWYRVARLKPRIRGHSQIHRHQYRGETWYVLQDHVSGRFYRFTPVIYRVIGLMDGKRTVQDLWESVTDYYGDDAPTQSEIVRLLSQLHSADVLLCDVPPDSEEILTRADRIERMRWKANLRSPLFLRFPLLDPERFLAKTEVIAGICFRRLGFAVWLVSVLTALVLVWLNWDELTSNIVDRVLARENLLLLWFVYPVVKCFHELGHGYAVKRWGGEVHEMGIMLLVFMPIPYVDATSAAAFRQKWQRVIVGAAGIGVELFLAALAVFAWVLLDKGLTRSVAYNVMLIGGVSTVLFNGNPLLRYDGYYILADLLNIPNLAQRSMQYLGYLTNRYLLAVPEAEPPYTGPGERFWFVFFGITSFVYRLFVYTAIIMFVAGKFFFIGVMLAILGGVNMVVLPVYRKIKGLLTAPLYQNNRGRTLFIVVAFIGLLAALLTLLPAPYCSRTEGVVWVPENSLVRAGASGKVKRIVTEADSRVQAGTPLIQCFDPLLETRAAILRSQFKEHLLRYQAVFSIDRVGAKIIEEELAAIGVKLAWVDEQFKKMLVVSPARGRFILPRGADLPDR